MKTKGTRRTSAALATCRRSQRVAEIAALEVTEVTRRAALEVTQLVAMGAHCGASALGRGAGASSRDALARAQSQLGLVRRGDVAASDRQRAALASWPATKRQRLATGA